MIDVFRLLVLPRLDGLGVSGGAFRDHRRSHHRSQGPLASTHSYRQSCSLHTTTMYSPLALLLQFHLSLLSSLLLLLFPLLPSSIHSHLLLVARAIYLGTFAHSALINHSVDKPLLILRIISNNIASAFLAVVHALVAIGWYSCYYHRPHLPPFSSRSPLLSASLRFSLHLL